MLDTIGGRKAAASLTVLLVGIIAVAVKGDIPANLLQLLEVVMGAYVVGNVASKAIGNRSSDDSEESPSEQPIQVQLPDADTAAALANIANGVGFVQELLQLIIRKTGLDKAPDPKQGA